jgi:hypothetical protein
LNKEAAHRTCVASLHTSVYTDLAARFISQKHASALTGTVSLITTLAGLCFTSLFSEGMTIGAISKLLASTLLVWVCGLIAGFLLSELLPKKHAA